jgi:uncharacterized protein
MEHAITFRNAAEQQIIGVWHAPKEPATSGISRRDATIVMLHGWSGYRTGPHQMLTRAARAFAAAGYGVLRFDFAGRGDSQGDTELATLATMAEDTRAALEWCRRKIALKAPAAMPAHVETESGSEPHIVLLGLCSGCEVAFAAAREPGVAALALWSAPVFAAEQSSERAARKRAHHLKEYARKLLRPATYIKLLTGRLDMKGIRKAMEGGGTESKNAEAQQAGQLPPGWRAAALRRFERFHAPLLLIYGTADPTTEEALAWYRERSRSQPHVHMVEGANHSYYGLAWEREVIDVTLRWLNRVQDQGGARRGE